MKKTIDIYTVMQTSEKDRDLCLILHLLKKLIINLKSF